MDNLHIFELQCKILYEAISQLAAIRQNVNKNEGNYLENELEKHNLKLRNKIEELYEPLELKNLTHKEADDLQRNIAYIAKDNMSKYYEAKYNTVLEFAGLFCKHCNSKDSEEHHNNCPVMELESLQKNG